MATLSQKTQRKPSGSTEIDDPVPVTIIRPDSSLRLIDIAELRQYRDLFYYLVLREIKVRYKQTVLGGIWAILQPLLTMVVFSLFFGRLAQVPSDNVPYPIFSFAALVPWIYFANAVSFSSNSLISNQAFINKVYFPRIAVPAASIFGWLLDFGIALTVLFAMMAVYGIAPTPLIVLLPVLVLLIVLSAAGTGMWLAALNVHYRDFRYVVPFVIQLWMFISPVAYPMSLVPERFRIIYALNPMAGAIEGFRSILLGTIDFPWVLLGTSTVVSILVFLSGLAYFKKTEESFADIV